MRIVGAGIVVDTFTTDCQRTSRECRKLEKRDEELIKSLVGQDSELKKYYEEHLDLERQLRGLQHKAVLTPEEDLEKKRIQKVKLAGKDRIMEILARHRAESA